MSDKDKNYAFVEQNAGMLKHGSVILFTCGGKGNFPLLSISKSAKELLGFKRSYFLTREHGWSNRIHPKDLEEVMTGFEKVLQTGSNLVNEYRFKRKDDTYIWLRDELEIAEDNNGDKVIYGSSIDITERKNAELALQEKQKQYQLVVSHINDITYSLDKEGRIRFLNDPWKKQMGIEVENSLGTSFEDFIYKEDRQGFKSFLSNLIAQKGIAQKILRMQPIDEKYYWAELYAECVVQEGELMVTGTIIDVTDNISRNKKQEGITQRLETLVTQRTQELEEEIQKRKDVEDHIQQRLSYEQAISKCSSLLLQSSSPKALNKSLQVIRQTTHTDRVYLYKNFEANGKLCVRLAVEACADSVTPNTQNEDTLFSYSQVPWWHEQLSSNNIINANLEELPKKEQAILSDQKVKSVLAIPIVVDDDWYGYIGFANTEEKRSWSDNEIQFLKTAANIISAHERRKQIQKSLIEQQNYTETILDSLPSIYLLVNENMEIEEWNKNAKQSTAYTPKEMGSLRFSDIISPHDQQQIPPIIRKVKNGNTEGEELDLLTKTGDTIPYSWRGYYITLNKENYYLFIGVDVTSQKVNQAKLTEEKQFSEALLESLPGTFYMFDEQGNFQRWNQNLISEMGYSAKELQEHSPLEFFAEKDHEKAQQTINTVFEEGQASAEIDCITKDGDTVPYLLTGKLFTRKDKNYLLGVGYDITKQVQERNQRRESEQLFRDLFLKAPAAIAMVCPDSNIQKVNAKFEQLFGYRNHEILGKDIDELLVPEEETPFAENMPTQNSKIEEFNKRTQRLTKEGELLDVFTGVIPVYIDDELIAAFGMYIDISQQKEFEHKLQQSLEEKKVLLQEIHHRIKNNLAVVTGLIQLQLYETENEEVKATLEESENRIQTMALIHEKLYSSQSLSGVSCRSYVNGLLETIYATNQSDKSISVITNIDDIQLSTTQAVPFALLINEVVTNAYKYAFADQKSGRINIDITQKEEIIHATIRDNGIGLPDNLKTEDSKSLGMTLVQNFMKQLEAEGGFKNDGGTCLELSFELKPAASSQEAIPE